MAHSLPPPTFDIDTWTVTYDGPLLPLRLAHVAVRCPSLARQSLKLAIDTATAGKDVQLYSRLCDLAGRLGLADLAEVDQDWTVRQDEANRRELSRLESELRGYKNNLIRESIRMGQGDLATHLLLTGGPVPDPNIPQTMSNAGYAAAYQAYGIVQAVAALQAGAAAGTHWNSVLVNAARLRAGGAKDEEQTKLAPIERVATGLAHLSLGQYARAGAAFLDTPVEYQQHAAVHGTDFARVVANANDVAVYGGLCALATLPRAQLLDTVLEGPFRTFLELEPQMRKAITLYTTAKYSACLDLLRRYYSDWSLDVFLGSAASPLAASPDDRAASHVDRLIARIRERSITAYFSAFSKVSLSALAATFPPSLSPGSTPTVANAFAPTQTPEEAAMETEVLEMIESGALDARLDAVNGMLVAPRRDARAAALADARAAADEIERALLLRLHKVNMILAGLEIPRVKASGDGLGGGVSSGGGGGGAFGHF